jgi:glycosyltransferase involved in cell wall biosynthesis
VREKLKQPLVSVVITTKNEEMHIRNCLKSIKKQTYPSDKIETIVVDNGSSDNTVKIAMEFTDKVFNMGPERSVQRNFGIMRSKGKYVLYLDADMILSKDMIRECVTKCESNGYIALYIPERVIGGGFWIKVRDFERSFYNATYIDAVRFVVKEKFLKTGGFDLSLTGTEDWDLDRKIRKIGKVGIVEAPLYHDEGEFKPKKYVEKKNYYFGTVDRYIQKWGKSDPIVKKQLGSFYRLFGVFVENGKWKKLLRHPLLALGIYILKFMVGIQYLKVNKK